MLKITKMQGGKWMRACRDGDAGQALIETALSLTFLVLLLVGVAEFAQVAYVAIEVSNAAKAAVQYGAHSSSAAADAAGITAAAVNDAYDIQGLTVPVISRSCTCANPAYVPSSCSDNTTCINGNTTTVQTLTVQTQATFTPSVHLPGLAKTFTLHGQATQKVRNQ